MTTTTLQATTARNVAFRSLVNLDTQYASRENTGNTGSSGPLGLGSWAGTWTGVRQAASIFCDAQMAVESRETRSGLNDSDIESDMSQARRYIVGYFNGLADMPWASIRPLLTPLLARLTQTQGTERTVQPRTPEERIAFDNALAKACLRHSSPSAHWAFATWKDRQLEQDEAIAGGVKQETDSRNAWIATELDPWCERHGLTRAQALSVAFDDQPFDERNPERDRATLKSLHSWAGQEQGFAGHLIKAGKADVEGQAMDLRVQAARLIALADKLSPSLAATHGDAGIPVRTHTTQSPARRP